MQMFIGSSVVSCAQLYSVNSCLQQYGQLSLNIHHVQHEANLQWAL